MKRLTDINIKSYKKMLLEKNHLNYSLNYIGNDYREDIPVNVELVKLQDILNAVKVCIINERMCCLVFQENDLIL